MADSDDTRDRLIAVEIRQAQSDKTIEKLTETIDKLADNQGKLFRLLYVALGAYLATQAIQGVNLSGILSKMVGV
jgi:uncharacterized coiled-coil protein SlyX